MQEIKFGRKSYIPTIPQSSKVVRDKPAAKLAVAKPVRKKPRYWLLRFSIQDQIMFAKRLAMLIRAGIPLLAALHMLRKQAKSKSTKTVFEVLVEDVENGQFISSSMSKFRKIFGEFAINIVQVGEVSGTLHENLAYLAEELKKKQALRRKLISSMLYPIFIVIATLGITVLLTVYLFPKILPIFSSVKFPLPWSTRALIFISNLLGNYGLYILLGLLLLVVAVWLLLRNKKFRLFFDRTLLRIPVFGSLLQGYHLANICRTMGLLMKSAVPIVRASAITADTTTNSAYQKELRLLSEHITKGEKISTHLSKNPKIFPSIMQQMIGVGESAGTLSETLSFLAEMYEAEVDDLTKNLTTVLEPALMVFMGIIVGFIAISIITPIYEFTQYLKP
ncbi:MAG: hypothetical protein A3B10_02370 [Candidatus Doudnabacteria bacterium RIFCSPLOWO2_01_FULL_44_21]|uniref:Type II secretion system protein GspF domain-containing protein n=1 Tax=Candidatus Doudnabacteria bacterium RIFCSPLOWO2_01_FULL_44_21 TaxID=1817841 RepID=A0A1F5PX20_9BACT|nr:MAG: hypothetical protein A3B95_02705 [Candidatus Doudnabacteria bacterium RIFCSPHIGHO2_02_FULL_43_13b]OGE94481.1 MAG: hypothetical protein A3B10_02370 [Candidatus Doudnabacteria bacterium RIFCSPLOWO2_01_FULL_44_21]